MQIVSSLLSLQSRYIKDENTLELFRDSQNRVKSMSLVHEKLYQSGDMTKIDIEEYIKNLTNDLFHSYGIGLGAVDMIINVDKLSLDVKTAIPCGLIINELTTNSLKHAFPDGRNGKISINFHLDNDEYILIVSDNGIGFPAGLEIDKVKSLGLRLVRTLTDQLGGTIELKRDEGTTFKITFKQIL